MINEDLERRLAEIDTKLHTDERERNKEIQSIVLAFGVIILISMFSFLYQHDKIDKLSQELVLQP